MRFSLLIEYDGTNYAGWQIQKNQRTIQGEIEHSLGIIFNKKIRITGAGRTDSGVHAKGQVAHFDLTPTINPEKLKRSLNGLLPHDIRIKSIFNQKDDFHARFDAIKRVYIYNICRLPVALLRHCCWYLSCGLNVEAMQSASEKIIGRHNFQSFCRTKSEVDNHFCTITKAEWQKKDEILVFEIHADRFLHGMVRSLVGTITDIGRAKLKESDILKILNSMDRRKASQAAPAKGLILEGVYYEYGITKGVNQ